MKKILSKSTSSLILLLLTVLPILTFAQKESISFLRPSYFRPYDKKGINVFETGKQADTIGFDALRVRLGAGFTQPFQSLKHQNSENSDATNKLYALTPGFNTSMANLNLDVQLADGIRLNLTTYLSTRHHNEAWVKGGYIQFDKLPFKGVFWDELMKVATIKIGHMEVNYGDAHFRRSDGGQTIYNPFIENYILDAFATEIGGEIYLQKNGFFGMIGLSNGMIKGNIDSLQKTLQDNNIHKSPALYFKGGLDQQLSDKLRVRFAGSVYHDGSSGGNTLFGGDRAGSNYFMVMEKAGTGVTYATNAFSGRINPGFSKKVDALQLNGFIKYAGLEFFGTYEAAKGRSKTETSERKIFQTAADIIYRFGKTENLFIGMRFNNVNGRLPGFTSDVSVNRYALAGGWFLTNNILLKGELVNQKYIDFPGTDYRNGGIFKGYVLEAVVGF